MAELRENIGIPTVEPSGEGERVEATPESFGAPLARGETKAGQDLQQVSQFYGGIAADNATNNWHKKVDTLLYGDPNNPDQPGYYALKGADAMKARPQVMMALEAAATEERGSLFTAESRFQFDQDTRRTRFLVDGQIGAHYIQQQQEWGLSTVQDKLDIARSSIAGNPNDPATLGLALTQAREVGVRTAQLRGTNPDVEVLKAEQAVRLTQFNALEPTNPAAALALLTSPGGEVLRTLPDYDQIYDRARRDTIDVNSTTTSDAAVNGWKAKAGDAVHNTQPAPDVKPYIDKVQDPLIRSALGFTSAGEAHSLKDYAGPHGDYRVAGPFQFDVPTWKRATGYDIPQADIGTPRDPRLDVQKSVDAAAELAQKNRAAFVSEFHHEPTAGDLALMHQQGGGIGGGGMKLLGALGTTPNAPAANFVSVAALTANNVPADATVAQAVRHIESYYTKGSGAEAAAPTISQSDFMTDHLQEAVDNYRTSIENDPIYDHRSDLIDKAVNSFEINYRRSIRDQNSQYMVDAHAIQNAIVTHHITSENDLNAVSPDIAATWLRLHAENPAAVEAMRNWFKANAGGQAKTYGSQFNNMLTRVLAPVGNHDRIDDPALIDHMITTGENSILTNTGANALHQIMDARNAPGGENDAATLRSFFAQAHTLIAPLTKPSLGQYNADQEKKYADFVGQSLQLIAAGRTSNVPLSELLKKGGAIDTALGQHVPTPAALRADRTKTAQDPRMNQAVAAAAALRSAKTPDDLLRFVKEGKISPHQASQAVIMNATTLGELQRAQAAGVISWDEAATAWEHLHKYNRSFVGKPFQPDEAYNTILSNRQVGAVTR